MEKILSKAVFQYLPGIKLQLSKPRLLLLYLLFNDADLVV